MRRDEREGLAVYRFESLPEELVVLVSTRTGGTSPAPFASLNMGLRVGDNPKRVIENRLRLFEAYGLSLAGSVWCKQVHADGVTVVRGEDAGRGALDEETIVDETDALLTEVAGMALCVTLADCVPVAIYDRRRQVLALIHAGWGGTVSRIASRTVERMKTEFGSDASDLLAAIGPSIGPADYEVGPEVIARAEQAYGSRADEILQPSEGEKALFDLWRANRIDLETAGIATAAIEVAEMSTSEMVEDFYSHRVEGQTGRFIAVAALVRS